MALTAAQIEQVKDLHGKQWTPVQIAYSIDADWVEVEDEIDRLNCDVLDGFHCLGEPDDCEA